jgi:translation initiation factor IF-2
MEPPGAPPLPAAGAVGVRAGDLLPGTVGGRRTGAHRTGADPDGRAAATAAHPVPVLTALAARTGTIAVDTRAGGAGPGAAPGRLPRPGSGAGGARLPAGEHPAAPVGCATVPAGALPGAAVAGRDRLLPRPPNGAQPGGGGGAGGRGPRLGGRRGGRAGRPARGGRPPAPAGHAADRGRGGVRGAGERAGGAVRADAGLPRRVAARLRAGPPGLPAGLRPAP